MTLPAPQGNPSLDLAAAIEEWLPSEFPNEWVISTKKVNNEEFKKLWPNIDPAVLSIGTLNGWGWILNIYNDRVVSFQVLPWNNSDGSEQRPLMAADPKFFEKLAILMHCIEDYRVRELAQRRMMSLFL